MGHTSTHDCLTCPKCGQTENYQYGFDWDSQTMKIYNIERIHCKNCGERLYSWQETKYTTDTPKIYKNILIKSDEIKTWIKKTAEKNNISEEWIRQEIRKNIK